MGGLMISPPFALMFYSVDTTKRVNYVGGLLMESNDELLKIYILLALSAPMASR